MHVWNIYFELVIRQEVTDRDIPMNHICFKIKRYLPIEPRQYLILTDAVFIPGRDLKVDKLRWRCSLQEWDVFMRYEVVDRDQVQLLIDKMIKVGWEPIPDIPRFKSSE